MTPAGCPPHTPPRDPLEGTALPGPRPRGWGALGRPPSPAYGGWKGRNLSALLLPWALAAVGSPRDTPPARLSGCAGAARTPGAGQIGKTRIPLPPVGLSPSATTGRSEEAPQRSPQHPPVPWREGITLWQVVGYLSFRNSLDLQGCWSPPPTPGPPASATFTGGAKSRPISGTDGLA